MQSAAAVQNETSLSESVEFKVQAIRQTIAAAEVQKNLPADSVCLVAASKTQSIETVANFANAGITCFGENYLQEAQPKIQALKSHNIEWHFIGHIQSNKAKQIAQLFSWVQTLDSTKLAHRLNRARLNLPDKEPLNCCIQVNIDQEPQKAGVLPEELDALLASLHDLPGLKIRGLMAIPKPAADSRDSSSAFSRLKHLFDNAVPPNPSHWDTLSAGMSGDYLQAIGCGANLVRLGTALFGPRSQP